VFYICDACVAKLRAEIRRKARMTFSKNCCSGIVHVLGEGIVCECWRCREKRGEEHNEVTESFAFTISHQAQKKFREQIRARFRENEKHTPGV
jgi:hypothetical protein